MGPTAHISVSGLDSICKLIRAEREKIGATIMVQVSSYKQVDVMTTYLPDLSRNALYPDVVQAEEITGGPCHISAPRGAKTGTQGLAGSVKRSVIPAALCDHIVDICEEAEWNVTVC